MKSIPKLLAAFLFILCLFSISRISHLEACTTFVLKDGHLIVFGRNYDWNVGVGQTTHTQWSIVYDVQNLEVHFRTRAASRRKSICLKEFDFSCGIPSLVIDIDTDRTGDITDFFVPYSTEINRNLIYKSYRQTEFLKNTPDQILEAHAEYPESIVCQSIKKNEK